MKNPTRREFLKGVGLGSLSLACSYLLRPGRALGTKPPQEKQNIVFILIDDMGFSDLGCYGNQFHETPNIDRLAEQGMRFTDAYAAAPVCSPARASIIAGQYPARVGITDFIPGHERPWAKLSILKNRQQYLPLEVVTVAEALKPAGYVSGAFGKWHLGGRPFYPNRQGFDSMRVTDDVRHFLNKDTYLAEALTDQGEKFIEANKDRPFFLYLSHFAVHIPLEARSELIEKYKNKPRPATGVNNPVYAAMVEHVDRSVGRILKKLDELNLADHTVVVFFSDNGGLRKAFTGQGPIVTTNAPLRDEKGTLYEGGIRVPLIVRQPGVVKPGSTCNVPVSSVDFYPTFLEIAGTSGDSNYVLDGKSILPLLEQTGTFNREAIFWHYPHYHHSTPAGAIRAGDWKLIEFYEDGQLELYNLKDDIGEKHNLAAKMPQKAAELQQKLAAWRKSVGAEMPTPNPDFDPARANEWRHQRPKKPRK